MHTNLHLHNHLKDCVLDYGPSHTFWCFSFERLNGILGSFHTNKKAVEPQIMRKFINTQNLQGVQHKANPEVLSLLLKEPKCTSSLSDEDMLNTYCNVFSSSLMPLNSSGIPLLLKLNTNIIMLPPLHEDIFSVDLLKDLNIFYRMIYSDNYEEITPFFVRCGRVTLCKQLIGSTMNS